MSEKTLAQPARAEHTGSALLPLLRRLHFYIGLFIGPFIFVAALTGALYVLTPQLENALYSHQLYTSAQGPERTLADQVRAAEKYIGPQAVLTALRPAPAPGETTRVMFTTPAKGSATTAVFVDPHTLEIRGMLNVYGTSGVLPLRTTLDYLHQSLLLGEVGRNYSELAASWLWVAALGGVLLWATSRAPGKIRKTRSRGQRVLRHRYWHSTLGIALLIGLLFFSATGLTWSRWAGDNISQMRSHFGWLTPSVNTTLPPSPDNTPARSGSHAPGDQAESENGETLHTLPMHGHHQGHPATVSSQVMDEHAEHKMSGMAMSEDPAARVTLLPEQFDAVVKTAREAGIAAGKIEVRPSTRAGKAWTVSEIDRRWPTRVDSVAVDPRNYALLDKVEFAQFGLLAKLTRWGVDAHMGVLFGLPNQLILAAFALGLCAVIVMGYRLWWLRRPPAGQHPAETLLHHWQRLSTGARFVLLSVVTALALSLPVMGISLLVMLGIDLLRWRRANRSAALRNA